MTARLCCPRCRSFLDQVEEGFICPTCRHEYPVIAGIPDLRLAPGPYLSLEEDRRKARTLIELDLGFADTIDAYWRMTPEVPAHLARAYTKAMIEGPERADPFLDELAPLNGHDLLDIGCGTGGLLIGATRRGARVTGIDIALRWLAIAGLRLKEEGAGGTLIAADGSLPPFRHQSFTRVSAVETLEHASDQAGLLNAAMALTAGEGRTYVLAANRLSLLPNPTFGLWGLGLLPRRLAIWYVAVRRHTRYQFYRPVSVMSLQAMLGPHSTATIAAGALPGGSVTGLEGFSRRLYASLRDTPPFGSILRHVGPFLEIRQ